MCSRNVNLLNPHFNENKKALLLFSDVECYLKTTRSNMAAKCLGATTSTSSYQNNIK